MKEASTFHGLLVNFSSMFTSPSFENFTAIACGPVLSVGRRTISRVIQVGGLNGVLRHHSTFYRFFSRARWNANSLGKCTLQLVLKHLDDAMSIYLTVDDTLCRKSGAHLWGGGMHHDPLRSNYGRGKTLVKFFSFGHNWVIICVVIPLPWNVARYIAIPLAFRLYRSKKQCPPSEYQKRTVLAREMVEMILDWIPEKREVYLIGDTEYACREVVRHLPKRIIFVGPMCMDAALNDPPPIYNGIGRPRKKGKRRLSPQQLAASKRIRWKKQTLTLYGREVTILMKTQVCLWYRVAGSKLVRMVVTRDPKGRIEDRAYFITDAKKNVCDIARTFSLRWTQEEMHHNVKQYLGLEDPQNGWWRRPAGHRRDTRIPGPTPHERRGENAVRHTAPFILTIYALVVMWYVTNGTPKEDVARARHRAPWYRHKTEPSFGDMLAALRRHIWSERSFSDTAKQQGIPKLDQPLLEWLCAI